MLAQRQSNRESRAFAWAWALGDDLPVVLFDDSVADRKTEPGALPSAATGEKGLEQMLHYIGRHAATVICNK